MSEFSEILISVEQKIVKLVEKKQELQSKNNLLTNKKMLLSLMESKFYQLINN